MDWFVLVLLMAAFGASMGRYCWLRLPERSVHGKRLDGDYYDSDEMLVAFGTTQDWV